jgi:hypothetical protein
LKEVGPLILKADTPHQTVAFEMCAGISKNSAWLLIAPLSAILFIDFHGEVKFGLITHNKSVKNTSICITDVHGPPTEGHTGSLILFQKSLCNLDFV